jgi:integrase
MEVPMQSKSDKPRRTRVAPGIYVQNDSYRAGFREPGSNRWRTQKLRATTLRAAKKERDSLLAALREGRLAARSEITLGALCDEWLATRRGRVSERTLVYDQGQVKRIKRVLGGLRVQALTVTDVRRLLAATATLAEWTRYGMLRTLRQVLKMARDEGLIVRDPSEALQPHERPKQKSRRKGRRLSPAELEAVITTAERLVPSFAPLIVLLAFTGMRIREALGLRWEDVDLDGATIRLRWQLAVDDVTRVELKTDAGARDIPILPALRRRLIEHRLASPWTRPADPVLAATSGKPKGYRNARRALGIVADELGVDLVSHDFRCSLASFLIIAARADEAAVTAVLGHANIEITRRLYAADWREAEERNALLLHQLAEAGIGQ